MSRAASTAQLLWFLFFHPVILPQHKAPPSTMREFCHILKKKIRVPKNADFAFLLLGYCQNFNFAHDASGQVLGCHTRARGLADKVFCVHCIECCKVGNVSQEAGGLHNIGKVQTRSSEDALYIFTGKNSGNARDSLQFFWKKVILYISELPS